MEQPVRGNVEGAGQAGDLIDGRRVPAVLDAADRFAVDPGERAEGYLGQTALVQQGAKAVPNGPAVLLDPKGEIVGHLPTLGRSRTEVLTTCGKSRGLGAGGLLDRGREALAGAVRGRTVIRHVPLDAAALAKASRPGGLAPSGAVTFTYGRPRRLSRRGRSPAVWASPPRDRRSVEAVIGCTGWGVAQPLRVSLYERRTHVAQVYTPSRPMIPWRCGIYVASGRREGPSFERTRGLVTL